MNRIKFETAKLAKETGFNKDFFFAVDALYPDDEHLAYDLTGETFLLKKIFSMLKKMDTIVIYFPFNHNFKSG